MHCGSKYGLTFRLALPKNLNFRPITLMETTTPCKEIETDASSHMYLCMVVLVAVIGGFLYGYSPISGAMIFLKNDFGLTPFWLGAMVGSTALGSALGALAAMRLADGFGRRRTLFISSGLFMLSAVGCTTAGSAMQFAVWQFLGGMGVALAATVSPMYIAEISPKRLRAQLVVANQFATVTGMLLGLCISYLFSFGGHWRWMFATEAAPILSLMIGLAFVPESPRWLAMVGRNEMAFRTLEKINGSAKAKLELEDIRNELGEESEIISESLLPGIRLAIAIGVAIMIFSQINGVNVIFLFSPILFQEAGLVEASNAILFSLYIKIWLLPCTLIVFWLSRRFGRRPILICGTIGMAVGHLLMFLVFAYHLPTLVVLVTMLVPTGAFALTLAPLSWVVLSEIFPNRVRGKAMPLCTCAMFVSSYVASNTFPMLLDWFKSQFGHPGGAFLIFLAVCLSCTLFVWLAVPETKDKTLEEIGRFWLRKTPGKMADPT